MTHTVGTLVPATPARARRDPVPGLRQVNPLTRIALAVVLSVPLLLTLDWVSASVAVALVVLVSLALGMRPVWLLKRAWWVGPVALLTALPMALYGAGGGRIYAHWWLITVSEGSVRTAVALGARVFALAVPSVILFSGVDATRMADALAQVARLPPRFVYGSLAGMRLTGLLRDDWRSLALARRARGLGDHARGRRMIGMGFALLVIAVRRGGRLAVAMEARGFGSGPRSSARRSTLSWRDPLAILIGLGMTVIAITCAVLADTFNPVV